MTGPALDVDALVDPVGGIVRRLVPVDPLPGMPPRYRSLTAEVADARRLGAWPADRVSMGASFGDTDAARTAALGEAVERYCGNRVPPGLRRATPAELARAGEAHLGPEELSFFAPWQYAQPGFPYQPLTEDTALLWARGTEGGDPCWVPASWAYLNFHTGRRRGEPRTHHLNYAGIATGADHADAARRGLLELLERDALELWWHLDGPTTAIDPDSVPGLTAELSGTRLRVHLVHLPTEHPVACVAAVVVDPETGVVGGGGAARLDPAEACVKAVLEAVHTWVFTQGLTDPEGWVFQAVRTGILAEGLYLPFRPDRDYLGHTGERFERVRDLGAQVQVWLDPRVQKDLLDRFTRPERTVRAADLPAATEADLRASLSARGVRVVEVDLTTPDVAHTPWRVVRTCATGLVPNAPAAFRYLGLPRWGQAARERGWADPDTGAVLAPPPFL
ncbi:MULTISPECIES: YcaO-like family protein [unclassified Nocardiopsis]|uniref:YcaO-like family protein n=1 Tax=unclassified Nocardiopsis TaxID=2649073 RepID=UPI001357AE36|nr:MULTISPECIES: YcaO-like family protein [unclassified Nocardiopsis]